ncbi:hypothetical protein K7432_018347, partial [Basidiobolus ranarum]
QWNTKEKTLEMLKEVSRQQPIIRMCQLKSNRSRWIKRRKFMKNALESHSRRPLKKNLKDESKQPVDNFSVS